MVWEEYKILEQYHPKKQCS